MADPKPIHERETHELVFMHGVLFAVLSLGRDEAQQLLDRITTELYLRCVEVDLEVGSLVTPDFSAPRCTRA